MRTLSDRTPTARKPHRCDWCGDRIEPGTKYRRTTHLGPDGLYEWIQCPPCGPLVSPAFDWAGWPDDGLTDDELHEWATEHTNDSTMGEQARAFLERWKKAGRR
jgi:hypothetical protein